MKNDKEDQAKNDVWPLMKNDLDWVMENWESDGCDLWEEIHSSDFFWNKMSQVYSLWGAADFADLIGESGDQYRSKADEIEKTIDGHWNGNYPWEISLMNEMDHPNIVKMTGCLLSQNAFVNSDIESNFRDALMDMGYDLEELYLQSMQVRHGAGSPCKSQEKKGKVHCTKKPKLFLFRTKTSREKMIGQEKGMENNMEWVTQLLTIFKLYHS
jgi:hypothetical protein